MVGIDALIITALKSEFEAASAALHTVGSELEPRDENTAMPFWVGTLPKPGATDTRIALARPTRMGPAATAPLVAGLVTRMQPRCLAMCGVCAGNPSIVALGDVIFAEFAYVYDEGKKTKSGFEGDHRQIPLEDKWLRLAQEITPDGLPSFRKATRKEARAWLLEQLYLGVDPKRHPARVRYLPDEIWGHFIKSLEKSELIRRDGSRILITDKGRDAVQEALTLDLASPQTLPYAVHVGPMASGNVVVKDGVTWDTLKAQGVRKVVGLEMEAATIAHTAHRLGVKHWVVAKGVMDYANLNKDDRFKSFAARASADVLLRFLSTALPNGKNADAPGPMDHKIEKRATTSVNTVENVSGSNINISQTNNET